VNHSDFLEYPDNWLKELRDLCSATGALFMVDEIQTGFGRCGAWKLMDVYGIQPDLICVGKGIANGLPVAGILTTESIASVITPGRHFSTFGGWPLGMKAINKVTEFVEPLITSGEIERKGIHLRELLNGKDWAKNVRGRGMLTVCNIDVDARRVCEIAIKHGILMATHRPWCLKLSPPLIISDYTLEWAVEQIDHVITKHGKDF
jgi:acetylornithine/succinyldiaminopimelate/putrescine aminotransferase